MPSLHARSHSSLVQRHRERLMMDSVAMKRKLEVEENPDSTMDLGDVQQERFNAVKRPCREIQPDPDGDNGVVLTQRQHHSFLGTSPPPAQTNPFPSPIRQSVHVEVYGCMKDVISSSSSSGPPAENCSPGNLTSPHHPAPFSSPVSHIGPVLPQPQPSLMSSAHARGPAFPSLPMGMETMDDEMKEQYHWMDMDGETYSPVMGNMDICTESSAAHVPFTQSIPTVQWP